MSELDDNLEQLKVECREHLYGAVDTNQEEYIIGHLAAEVRRLTVEACAQIADKYGRWAVADEIHALLPQVPEEKP